MYTYRKLKKRLFLREILISPLKYPCKHYMTSVIKIICMYTNCIKFYIKIRSAVCYLYKITFSVYVYAVSWNVNVNISCLYLGSILKLPHFRDVIYKLYSRYYNIRKSLKGMRCMIIENNRVFSACCHTLHYKVWFKKIILSLLFISIKVTVWKIIS